MKKLFKIFITMLTLSTLIIGCGSNSITLKSGVSISDVVRTIVENNEVTMPEIADDTIAESIFYLNLDDVEEYSIEFSMVNVSSDNVALVKAKDGKTEDIKKSLKKRLEDVRSQFQYYLPDQFEKVENAQIYVKGNYVLLAIVNDSEKAIDILNENLTN